MAIHEVTITATGRRRWLDVGESWRYRDLLLLLVRRNVSVRYRQTALGVLWAVLQPIGTIAIFSLVFSRLARLPSEGVPYTLFALAGLVVWQFVAASMNAAGSSLLGNQNLITKVYIPRLVIPASALGAPAVDLAVATGLMAMLTLAYGTVPAATVVMLPLLYAVAALIAFGVGCFTAALSVSYRDFQHLMPFLTTSWMWLTPIAYPPGLVPPAWRPLLFLNPMAGVIDAVRAAWFGRPVLWGPLAWSVACGLLLFCAGVAYFRSVERRFADVI